MKLSPLKGMKDLLPEEYMIHEHIINKARRISSLQGYKPISTPILEYTQVFDRSLGDTSDVVSKEMYSFLDRNQKSVALRPEFTAGIVRAFISNLQHSSPIKLFSTGPLFRYENPQAGRQRQFHQINIEHVGAVGPQTDAEVIKLGADILKSLNIDNCELHINSLGDSETRENYQKNLVEYFNNYKEKLSEDSRKRLLKNPLRILDSKDEEDRKIVQKAPLLKDFYSEASKEYFMKVLNYLEALGVSYKINDKLVRGLDYYCHTAFEFISSSENLGSQSTVLGGGRYDGLIKLMGGGDVPAIGFGAGIERLALAGQYTIPQVRPLIVMPIEESNINSGLKLADNLRQAGIETHLEAKGKIGKRLERALQKETKAVIFIGEEEEKTKLYKLKDLDKKEEQILSIDEIKKWFKKL